MRVYIYVYTFERRGDIDAFAGSPAASVYIYIREIRAFLLRSIAAACIMKWKSRRVTLRALFSFCLLLFSLLMDRINAV